MVTNIVPSKIIGIAVLAFNATFVFEALNKQKYPISATPIEIPPNIAQRYVFEGRTKILSTIEEKYIAKMQVTIKANIYKHNVAAIPLLLLIF